MARATLLLCAGRMLWNSGRNVYMCWNKRGGAGLGAGGLMVWRGRPLPQQPPGMLAAAWLAGGLRPRASQAWAGAGSAAAALLPLPRPKGM